MKYIAPTTLAIILASTVHTLAGETPTVTLSQVELQTLIAAENATAIAQYLRNQAKPVYDKTNVAFAPKPIPTEAKPSVKDPPHE